MVQCPLPSLSRIHDRLKAHDEVTRFRLSQNLERPHEKVAAACLVAMPAFRITRDTSPHTSVIDTTVPAVTDVFASKPSSRAPPAC